jgi:hypothetical protein
MNKRTHEVQNIRIVSAFNNSTRKSWRRKSGDREREYVGVGVCGGGERKAEMLKY